MIEVERVLEKLVSFNTIKDKENKEILDYIENTLQSLGFKTEKRNKFLAMSNKEKTSLGFLGHTDTVEFTSGWKYNKFELTKNKDKLYGLGICDMKSGIAAMIAAISQINFDNYNKGMKLYFTYDEEIGFSGIKELIEYEKDFPKTIIIGEPTNNEIVVGSKGLMEYKISFKGIKTHSSTPEKGKSAILSAISFINELSYFYENKIKNKLNHKFDIPYTTMNIGKINGGSAINSVPESCELLVDFRTIDKKVEQYIIKQIKILKEKYKADVIELNRISAYVSNFKNYNKTCNFITEASFLKGDRIILGAGPTTSHEVNEYITTTSLNKLVKQYKEFIVKYCE